MPLLCFVGMADDAKADQKYDGCFEAEKADCDDIDLIEVRAIETELAYRTGFSKTMNSEAYRGRQNSKRVQLLSDIYKGPDLIPKMYTYIMDALYNAGILKTISFLSCNCVFAGDDSLDGADYVHGMLLIPRCQRFSMRKNSPFLLFLGLISMFVVYFVSDSIYGEGGVGACVDPLIRFTVSVVDMTNSDASKAVWLILACMAQLCYACSLIQQDANLKWSKLRVTRATALLSVLWRQTHPSNMRIRRWREKTVDSFTCCNRVWHWIVFSLVYVALFLLMSIPEVAFVLGVNGEQSIGFNRIMGNSTLIAVVRAVLASTVLPNVARAMCNFKCVTSICLREHTNLGALWC